MSVELGRAALAFARFGLGPRPGDLSQSGDGLELLRHELKAGTVATPVGSDLITTPAILSLVQAEFQARRLARAAKPDGAVIAAGKPEETGSPMVGNAPSSPRFPAQVDTPAGLPKEAETVRPVAQRLYRAEVSARLAIARGVSIGFVERLVWFWANHFTVSAAKGPRVRATTGAFEREAIRPHVLGRFSDMLLAAELHPAMLIYLDNVVSVGPNSPAGARKGKGLNENLGREILELHTLGVGSGYTQDDVTNLARILTGWTIAREANAVDLPGSTVYHPAAHEPGALTLLNKSYPDADPEQVRMALLDLARRPATAEHIATKLARHFVADEPPKALVAKLAQIFRETDGDLARVCSALIEAPEAWSPEAVKVRSPQEFLVAAMRGFAVEPDPVKMMAGFAVLGQPFWAPPGPNGYSDRAVDWASPEGMKTRLDIAARFGQAVSVQEPAAFLESVLGASASQETRAAVLRAESRPQATALLLMSPEFQRR